MFRKTRIDNEQLQAILRSLPQAKASADFEENLDRMIASNSHHVPNLLGSLPLVPAPDDFDARLMEAIRDKRRPIAPIPIAVAAGGASINWLNHIMGWIGGSLAVVALAFFINHATEITPEASKAPAVAKPAAGQSVTVPAVALPAPHTAAAPGSASKTVAVAEPQAVAGASRAARPAETVPALRPHREIVTPAASTSEHVQVSTTPAASVSTPQASQPDTRGQATDGATVNGAPDVATGPKSTDTSATQSADNNDSSAPNIIVNTGGDPGVDTNRPR
jgi:hypothetical protein